VIRPVTEPSHAVFLSYASEDQAAAQRICDALRAGGIEVWFDQSALRGGDAWDQAIRKQIKTCVLFIPVISRHTHDRDEGYFRFEWKLAVDRSHLMTSNKAFLLPVVIDETREDDENVPEKFKDIHWTRLPAGETPAAFVERVRRLVAPEPSRPTTVSRAAPVASVAPPVTERLTARPPSKRVLQALAALAVIGALAYFAIDNFWVRKQPQPTPAAVPASAGPARFSPPPHSIAVLPFVNFSGDKEQEYFSEGLTEELLNSLTRINELRVAARTSSFSFQGEHPDIVTVAHKLNVGAVLEGSVRRSAHTIRITAQLVNGITGFHVWSQTYDRDLGDMLRLQTDIAIAVADALKVTMLSDLKAKVELGGTRNPDAFDAYLRASKAHNSFHDGRELQAAIASYTEALGLDPDYALAYAARSKAFSQYAGDFATQLAAPATFAKAQVDARHAIVLAPDLAEGHLALALFFKWGALDFAHAMQEYDRAVALAPNSAEVLQHYGISSLEMGRIEAGISATRHSVSLDPLSEQAHGALGEALLYARRYEESLAAFQSAATIDASAPFDIAYRGLAYYGLGKFQDAISSCAIKPDNWLKQTCRAVAYDKLGRHSDSEAVLMMMKTEDGDSDSYLYALIYAQRGDVAKALKSLETAFQLHDAGLVFLKVDPLLDPLRKESRFQAIERELKFPN